VRPAERQAADTPAAARAACEDDGRRAAELSPLKCTREIFMPSQIPTGEIHHLRLTVTDLQRSRQFYTSLLGFDVVAESPPADDPSAAETFRVLFGGVVMARGNLILGLRPMAPPGDRFDPDRVGLDHLSFGVASRDDLDQAARLLDEQGVRHGEISSLPAFGIDVLSFEDPDGVQLELTAPAPSSA
jgi:catechol 2,3-dioxygenase-like lactoylglutathione lyase family enzyme